MAMFKKVGGKVFGAQLSKAEQQALNEEINRQIAIKYKEWLTELDAMILWTLHTHPQLRFGKKRLERFYKVFTKQHLELISRYECGDNDDGSLCVHKLKSIGVDLETLSKEFDMEESNGK